MTQEKSLKILFETLAVAIQKIESPDKDATGAFKNKYVPLDNLLAAVIIPLASEGITIDATMDFCGEHLFCITTIRMGDLNHSNKTLMILEKRTPQGIASAFTYARRIGLCSLLSIGGSVDDDGEAAEKDCRNAASTKIMAKKLDYTQVAELEGLSKGFEYITSKCFKHYKVTNFADLPQIAFSHTKNAFLREIQEINATTKEGENANSRA